MTRSVQRVLRGLLPTACMHVMFTKTIIDTGCRSSVRPARYASLLGSPRLCLPYYQIVAGPCNRAKDDRNSRSGGNANGGQSIHHSTIGRQFLPGVVRWVYWVEVIVVGVSIE